MANRGVKSTWRGKLGYSDEVVCLCKCHEPGARMRHFIACCGPPKTEAGRLLLEAYNDELLVKIDNQ